MPIRAVAFDYGNVLTRWDRQVGIGKLAGLLGRSTFDVEECFMRHRLDYDQGVLAAPDYWCRVADCALTLEQIADLVRTDVENCLNLNKQVSRWAGDLKEAGFRIAILSNMPSDVLRGLRLKYSEWLNEFEVKLFSCELGCTKPDRAIYLHLLNALNLRGEEVVFIDDVKRNVDPAVEVGMHGIVFDSLPSVKKQFYRLIRTSPQALSIE